VWGNRELNWYNLCTYVHIVVAVFAIAKLLVNRTVFIRSESQQKLNKSKKM